MPEYFHVRQDFFIVTGSGPFHLDRMERGNKSPRGRGCRVKIISGGQTGVDRAALDFAIQHGCEQGGWCPHGRLAEDGVIPPVYQLRETDSPEYDERTEKNVMDSDATLIVTRQKELSGGTAFTKACAEQHGRPVLVICESDGVARGAAAIAEFLKRHKVRTLNVAGPRESQAPGIGRFVEQLLGTVLGTVR